MPQTAAFVVQMAGPVAGVAGGVAALFRPEVGSCIKKRPLLFARGRYERPLSVALEGIITGVLSDQHRKSLTVVYPG